MLRLLLDSHISNRVAEQIERRPAEHSAISLNTWRGGSYRCAPDGATLIAARAEKLTLVTYDIQTIPIMVHSWYRAGQDHAGVVLVSHRTIASDDSGGLVRAVTNLLENAGHQEWINRVVFLLPAKHEDRQ